MTKNNYDNKSLRVTFHFDSLLNIFLKHWASSLFAKTKATLKYQNSWVAEELKDNSLNKFTVMERFIVWNLKTKQT